MQEMKYCQSCAMPLAEGSQYGSNLDGSKNEDYCSYCYEKGKFTSEASMEEMIEFCVGPMVDADPNMSEEQAREMMQEYFPTLKRWSQQ